MLLLHEKFDGLHDELQTLKPVGLSVHDHHPFPNQSIVIHRRQYRQGFSFLSRIRVRQSNIMWVLP